MKKFMTILTLCMILVLTGCSFNKKLDLTFTESEAMQVFLKENKDNVYPVRLDNETFYFQTFDKEQKKTKDIYGLHIRKDKIKKVFSNDGQYDYIYDYLKRKDNTFISFKINPQGIDNPSYMGVTRYDKQGTHNIITIHNASQDEGIFFEPKENDIYFSTNELNNNEGSNHVYSIYVLEDGKKLEKLDSGSTPLTNYAVDIDKGSILYGEQSLVRYKLFSYGEEGICYQTRENGAMILHYGDKNQLHRFPLEEESYTFEVIDKQPIIRKADGAYYTLDLETKKYRKIYDKSYMLYMGIVDKHNLLFNDEKKFIHLYVDNDTIETKTISMEKLKIGVPIVHTSKNLVVLNSINGEVFYCFI